MADLLNDCMADLRQQGSVKDFQETFCTRCRNVACDHAKWSADKFGARVATQVDRLFNTPQADPGSSRYAMLGEFRDMLEQAVRLEVSAKRADWEVPEIPILDGRVETATAPTTGAVDQAVQALARTRGRDEVDLPNPEVTEEQIRALPDAAIRELEKPAPAPLPRVNPVVPPTPKTGNTPAPTGGILLGGPGRPAPEPPADPWEVKPDAPRKVEPGARIRLGGTPPDDKGK